MKTLRWLLTLGFLGTALWMADVSGQIRPVPGTGNVSNATGTLAVTHGGTALTTLTAHNVYVGNGGSAPTAIPGGTNCALFWTASSSDPTCNVSPTFTVVTVAALTAQSVAISATPPTVASGGCTNPAVTDSNGTESFKITLGTTCTGVKTFTLTMPAATHQWSCNAHDLTTPATYKPDETAAASTTAVVITNYSRTTGLAIDFADGEVLRLDCHGG